jgi:hypothetical protein
MGLALFLFAVPLRAGLRGERDRIRPGSERPRYSYSRTVNPARIAVR